MHRRLLPFVAVALGFGLLLPSAALAQTTSKVCRGGALIEPNRVQ